MSDTLPKARRRLACGEFRAEKAFSGTLPLEQPHYLRLGQRIEMQIEADDRR